MDLDRTVNELARGLLAYAAATSGDPHLGEEAAQEALTALVVRWRRKGPPARASTPSARAPAAAGS